MNGSPTDNLISEAEQAFAACRGLGRAIVDRLIERCREHDQLLAASLAINDKLDLHTDHAEFVGSMNDVENFRELVNRLWHQQNGWAPRL